MTNNNSETKQKKLEVEFQNALLLRNFEIDLFWKRVWFYGALLLGVSAAYYELRKSSDPIVPEVCVSFIGIIIAISQSLICRGSKYWQERWEYITKNRETAIEIELTKNRTFNKQHESYYIHASILDKNENILTRSHRFSVSKLTFFVWDIISISFFLVWVSDIINLCGNGGVDWRLTLKLSSFYLVIIIYSYFFWKDGKLFDKLTLRKESKEFYKNESEKYLANKLEDL